MTPQDKFQKIMEVMSDKTLSFGCVIKGGFGYGKLTCYEDFNEDIDGKIQIEFIDEDGLSDESDEKFEIIGHPLHIGDVLEWIENNDGYHTRKYILLDMWTEKRLPLQVEDTDLVDFIYNLLP